MKKNKIAYLGGGSKEWARVFILGSIAKSPILQFPAILLPSGGCAAKSRRSYAPAKPLGFAAAFGGIANNCIVCNRGQYMTDHARELFCCAAEIENTYYGIKRGDFAEIFEAFVNQPLCSVLSLDKARELFRRMVIAANCRLDGYFPTEKPGLI